MSHTAVVVGLTDVGKARTRNEDSLSLIPELGVAVVADGMGGHPGGNVASRIASETAAQVLEQELQESTNGDGGERLGEAMTRSVLRAHEEIRAHSRETPELEGMGTTLTALVVDRISDAYVLGHVGDSRAYLYRGGRLKQLTHDDTWVQERVDADLLTAEQARRHPFSHLLTQCLGLDEVPAPHILQGPVQIGDVYLLCTDGLVGMLEDAELERILAEQIDGTRPPAAGEAAVQALLDAANAAGGYDNITAVLVSIVEPDKTS